MRDKKNLVVSYTSGMGYVVYDKLFMDGIDVFPDTSEGRERLLEYGKEVYGVDLNSKLVR